MKRPAGILCSIAIAISVLIGMPAFAVVPADFGFLVPNPEPTLPSGIEPFAPPEVTVTTTGPEISEMLRTAAPGEIFTLTGEKFLQGTTNFQVFAQTSTDRWRFIRAEPLIVEAQTASVRLPESLRDWSMALVWPENRGKYGKAFALNRTDGWWLGPNPAIAGQAISVYGRNLAKANGTTTSFIYIKPSGSSGSWVTPTAVNPYKVDFVVPSLSAGSYEVWIHNGHGGHYGWSGPLTLQINAASPWAGQELTTYNVKTYGAIGDGVADDGAAIEAARADAEANAPSTLYFPAGTYAASRSFSVPSDVRWLGDSRDTSILKLIVPLSTISGDGFLHQGFSSPQNAMFENITINADNQIDTWPNAMIFLGGDQVKFKNSRLSTWGSSSMEIYAGGLYFENLEMIGTGSFLDKSTDVFIQNSTFKMTNDGEAGITSWGGKNISLTNNTFINANESLSTGFGIGRLFVNQKHFGNSQNMYFGGNESINYAPRDCTVVDCNKGEQILFEQVGNSWMGTPTAVTSTTATFSAHSIVEKDSGISVSIIGGKGLGQTRLVTSLVGNTITIDRPWDVLPNTSTSLLQVSANANKIAIYSNTLQGNSGYSTDETSSTGVLSWGNVYNLIIDKNNFSKFRFGVMVNSTGAAEETVYSPNFALVGRNIITDSFIGLYTGNMHKDYVGAEVHGGLGIVFRSNSISNIDNIGIALETWDKIGGDFHATVFEKNSVVNAHHGIIAAEKIVWTIPPASFNPTKLQGTHFKSTILSENTFDRGTAPLTDSIGFRSEPFHTWLNVNSYWEGFADGNMLTK